MKVYKWMSIILILFVFCLGLGCASPSQDATNPQPEGDVQEGDITLNEEPVKLAMATMEVGTSFYSYGSLFAEKIRQALPEGSNVDVLPYGGAVGCVQIVAKGVDANLGLTSLFLLDWASKGILAYENEQIDNVRLLVAGLDTYFLSPIARKDAPFNSLEEILDKRLKVHLATKKPGSLADYGAELLLNAYGLSHDKIREFGGRVDKNDIQVIADDMRNGRVELDLDYYSVGHPVITELATQLPLKFLPLEAKIIDDLCRDFGFSPVVLPAGSFHGQDQDVPLVGGSTCVITNTDLPDDVAYAVTKAMVENSDYFKSNLAALKEFTPERAVETIEGVLFHPGAERYYREVGLLK